MDEMKPGTALPWRLDGACTIRGLRGDGGKEFTVAMAWPDPSQDGNMTPNARYIVHTANTFPVLVEALEAFQAHVIRHSCTWDDAENGSHHHPVWQQVANALALARGQQ